MSKYDDLVKKLKEIFQIDRPELDFGVYRILNIRADEVKDYLEKRLKAKVAKSLGSSGAANMDSIYTELKQKEGQYSADGLNPDAVPTIIELRKKLAGCSISTSEDENAVFTHLLTFFSRYYDKGDFVSQRRYKGDTYAIPYAGEEVMLHWANKDQYYTKSSENFSNYAFKLEDGRSVRFRLVTADTAKDNRKDNDKERRFVLTEQQTRTLTDNEGEEYEEEFLPVEEINDELILRFEYRSMPKGSKQEDLVAMAAKTILDDPIVKTRWLDLSKREPTEKNPQRTLLEKCLTNYTTKNTADYFIHKDLNGFLRRELDFYIKNEVMHLDDLQNAEKFADIEKNLCLIQTFRAIALDLVTFLAQLEDFQKKLWLKKKFVVSSHYCITLDRVPESLYPMIAANSKQWEQWNKLGMLEIKEAVLFNQANAGSIEHLKGHLYLMVDTTLFDVTFKQALLSSIDNLDESLDGLLIHGDNFQSLNLLKERYSEQVDCVYIDPPYNAKSSEIIYKNSFKHSSFLTFLHNRISCTKSLLNKSSLINVAIDDYEHRGTLMVMDDIFSNDNFIANVVVQHNPRGRNDDKFYGTSHEYMIVYALDREFASLGHFELSDADKSKYKANDGLSDYDEASFMRTGNNSDRHTRPNLFYPIYVNPKTGEFSLEPKDSFFEVLPINSSGEEKTWRWGKETFLNKCNTEISIKTKDGVIRLYKKRRLEGAGKKPKTIWHDSKYDASSNGIMYLRNLLGKENEFSYPKSIHSVRDTLHISSDEESLILDYFAGSGTTGDAVINLNRQDRGNRKYILVEQGEYFDTVTKPRIQKVVYSADWKNGKPTSPQTGVSHAFKVLKLESYEDTLNNLQLRCTASQSDYIDNLPQSAKEDYLLRYMLEIESRGSPLSVEHFNKPFDCKLKVAVDSAGAYEECTIDLVETFNYLIGLRVKDIDIQQDKGFVLITGWLPTGEKTLVLWRDVKQLDYEKLNRLCEKLAIDPSDNEFKIVYINGDHNIPAVFTSTQAEGGITKTMKIRQIEPEFLGRMFTVEGM
jgi:adenine-specific DNA-methyltransferase